MEVSKCRLKLLAISAPTSSTRLRISKNHQILSGGFYYSRLLAIYPLGVYNIGGMDKSIKKQVQNRLKRLEGQVRGLQKMVEEDKYCVDVINQSSAVRSALSSVENLMLENHLSEHVVHQMKGNQEKKAVKEIVDVFKIAKKK